MANIVITSGPGTINIDYNDYAGGEFFYPEKECWHSDTAHFKLKEGDAYVSAMEDNGSEFDLSWNGASGTMQVDSVDGVAPTSNSDLYDKLVAIVNGFITPLASANVTCNNTTTTLVSSNTQRKGLVLINTGSNAVYLGLGEAAVVNKGIYLAANGGTWVMDSSTIVSQAINGITTASTSNISIQEFQ